PDEREEGSQEGAARGPGASGGEAEELVDLEPDESEAENPREREADLRPEEVVPGDRKARHAAGEAREEEAGGLHRGGVQIEELARAGAAVTRLDEHRVGGEEAGKEDHVGEDEEPEPVADHDAPRRGAAGAVA